LSDEQRKRMIGRLEKDVALFEEIVAATEQLTDSRRVLWRYLARSGYRPCSDIFDKISDTDVVEIYSREQIHLCQNLNFYDWISITLERVLCETWFEATWRDPEFERQLHDLVFRFLSTDVRETIDPKIDWHGVKELESEMLYQFQIRIKWMSPIFVGREVVGFILINECRDLESQRTESTLTSPR
jgi:hypothetical protein